MKSLRLFCSFLILAAGAAAISAPRHLSEDRLPNSSSATVSCSLAQSRTFQTTFETLAQQAHIAIVAEGVPLHPLLPEASRAALTKPMPLSEALQTAADAYDYQVSKEDGVYLLEKRYSDPQDLPEVTISECLHAVQAVAQAMKPFALDTTYPSRGSALTPLLPQIWNTLTPEQMQALKDNNLPVASLSPEQQDLIIKFADYFYVQDPLDDTETALARLQPAASCAIGVGLWLGHPFFGYTGGNHTLPSQFSPFIEKTGQMPDGTYAGEDHGLPGPSLAITTPKKGNPKPAATDAVMTLGKMATTLTRKDFTAEVNPDLTVKPVSVFGVGNATPLAILRAMAALYGLFVRTEAPQKMLLTYAQSVLPANVRELPQAIWAAIPLPVQHALRKGLKQTPLPSQAIMPPGEENSLIPEFRSLIFYVDAPDRMHDAAIARMRLDVDPILKKSAPGTMVPLSSLSDTDRASFALAMMTDFLKTVRAEYDRPAPDFVVNLDQAILRGGPYRHPDSRSEWKFAFNMATLSADGKTLNDGPGTFDMPYFPPQTP